MKIMIKFAAIIIAVLGSYQVSAQKTSGTYRVLNEVVNQKPVSPLIYGNFIELGFGRQPDGMWSEKLFNASFEEIIPYKQSMWNYLRKSPDDDLTKKLWWHSGYEENQWYGKLADGTPIDLSFRKYGGFYHGYRGVALNNSKSAQKAFLAQDRIYLNKGIACNFKGYIANNSTGNNQPVIVTVGLYRPNDFTHPLAEKTITPDGTSFKEYSAVLNAADFEGYATFAVSVNPGSSVSFDGFSLMPADNINGWRKDVIEALKQIHVPVIRYPGGCFASFYNWKDGIGPRADRKPINSDYWGGLEENNIGTAEFVSMCRIIGAEPFICVNMLTSDPSNAAEWVAYCNSTKGDMMNNLRKEHGYSEPLRVKYWELDNETYRRFGWDEYARRCVLFSKAMKAVDPSVQTVMVGYHAFNLKLKEMLDIAGPYIDLITDRSGVESVLQNDLKVIGEYNKAHGTNIRLCNTEWWPVFPKLFESQDPPIVVQQQLKVTWNYAMNVAARFLLFQRLGGDFEFGNFNNLCNTWGQNIIESTKEKAYISASGRVCELMSRSDIAWIQKTDTLKNNKNVVVQAGTSSDKKLMTIYILNYSDNAQRITTDLSAFAVNTSGCRIRTLFADGPYAYNKWPETDRIKKSDETTNLKNSKPVFDLRPWSLTEVQVALK